MKKSKPSVNRRNFFKSAAGAAALASATPAVQAQRAQEQGQRAAAPGAVPAPTQEQLARDAGNVRPPATARAVTRPGSDLMVQAFRDLGLAYVAAQADRRSKAFRNPSSTIAPTPTRCRSSSRRCTKNRRWRWPTVTPRPKASRCSRCCTALSDCSTPRWPSTTPTTIARPS